MKGYPRTVIYLLFDLDWKLHRPGDPSGAECLKKSSLEAAFLNPPANPIREQQIPLLEQPWSAEGVCFSSEPHGRG